MSGKGRLVRMRRNTPEGCRMSDGSVLTFSRATDSLRIEGRMETRTQTSSDSACSARQTLNGDPVHAGPDEVVRRAHGGARREPRGPIGRGRRPARAEWRRQDHDVLHDGRAHGARLGPRHLQRRGHHRSAHVRRAPARGLGICLRRPRFFAASRSSRTSWRSSRRSSSTRRPACTVPRTAGRAESRRRWRRRAPTRCRAASGDAQRSHARSSFHQNSSCSTSRSPASIRSPSPIFRKSSFI